MREGPAAPDATPARSEGLDCVVCGQEIALDDEVIVVWSVNDSRPGSPDVPTAVSLARCQDRIDVSAARTTGPYSLREALREILASSRLRSGGRYRAAPPSGTR
jgi:hypothetical protein